ncbi:hypothetical protein C0992_001424 [Termitomyces sp. T32_za158]|nr:hypothetical protein C0992_001424 [Termitomyces sp. T32_za158]
MDHERTHTGEEICEDFRPTAATVVIHGQRVHAKEDVSEGLLPIAPGLAYHDSSSVGADLSLPIAFQTLSTQVSQHQRLGRPQDDMANFFEKLTYHSVSVEELCAMLGTVVDRGLDNVIASCNIQQDGRNTITKKKPSYLWKIITYLFGGFCSILWVAVIIFFICWRPLGNPDPQPTNFSLSILIIIVILCQASFSAFQDWSISRIVNSILYLMPSECIVIREGRTSRIPAADLAVGDLVMLSVGNKVPADMRLIETSDDLRFDRSVLTGESEEMEGTAESGGETFLEADNIALMGTHITNGHAKGVVVLTGDRTVVGHISKLMNKTKRTPTPIEQEIWRFVCIIIFLTVALALSIFVIWYAWLRRQHESFMDPRSMLVDVMGCIVSFMPQGMPIAVTLTLTLIARRMRRVSVLPKSLSTIETLGCVTVICSDKTGTLTQNKMSVMSAGFVDKTYTAQELREKFATEESAGGESAIDSFYKAAVLCNGATATSLSLEKQEVNGDATDSAIFRFIESFGDASAMRTSNPQIYQVPFNSRNKWMLTMHNSPITRNSGNRSPSLVFVKGAPDVLISRCSFYVSALTNDIQPFDSIARAKLMATQEKWSRDGQRVILLCMREYNPCHTIGTNEFSTEIRQKGVEALTIVGILGLIDLHRPESADTVKDCKKAGIRFFMVTGDLGWTAVASARKFGIITTHAEPDSLADVVKQLQNTPSGPLPSCRDPANRIHKSLLLEGKDLFLFTEDHWNIATRYEEIVFARTTPEQKLGIVTAFKKRDNVVAVTGDGVNDAPALKEADIGVAVVSGSDVAIEAADLVLLGTIDSIIGGIRLGRLVFQNMQKVIVYLLPAGSCSEIWPVFINASLGLPLPLSSFLMIVICCFTDLLPCISLVMEKEEFDLLTLPPRRPKKDHLINLKIYAQAYLFIGMMETVIAHAMFFLYYWRYARIPIGALFLSYEKYSEGFYGYSFVELNNFQYTAQCVYFVTLVILQWGNLLSVRNKRLSILQADPIRKQRRNIWSFFGAFLALITAILVTEVHVFQTLFLTAPVPLEFWFIPLPLSLSILLMDEIRKLVVRTYPRGFLARIAW